MRIIKLTVILLVCISVVAVSGCDDELKKCQRQNNLQSQQLEGVQAQYKAAQLELQQKNRQLEYLRGSSGVEVDKLRKDVSLLEEDIAKKKELIAAMQGQLLYGGAQLPVELSSLLEDFANKEDMVTFDTERGIVKFKSDLLFPQGSDEVGPAAIQAVAGLCKILNTEQGKQFDIIIAGHTDDVPIGKPATRAKHPTNWHLSPTLSVSTFQPSQSSSDIPSSIEIIG